MPARNGAVHVATTKRVYKGKTYVTHLLRRSIRKGKTVTHETLGNLSHLPDHLIDLIKRSLKGEVFVPAAEAFRVTRSLPHGHVEVVLKMIRKLGLDELVASEPSRRRDLVIAMIAERLLFPSSKLANTRHWHDTTLAEELGVADADEDQLYDAMDWLLERQETIEKKLARRHLSDGALVLYDVTSSYYEGKTCPLARFGHDRDGKTGCPIIVYGALTDADGRPIAVHVYPGNTGDPKTIPDQVEALTKRFGLSRVVLVGDRGMLTPTQIDVLKKHPGLGWISALRSGAIRRLLADGRLIRVDLEADRLAEITSPEFPDERLVACYNPQLAEQRRQKRQDLLAASQAELETLAAHVARPAGPRDGGRDRREGGQDHQPLQDGQTFYSDDSRRPSGVGPQGRRDQKRRASGWDLCDPDQRAGRAADGGRRGAVVQATGLGGAGVPVSEGDRSVGAADSPPHGRPGAGAHPAVPAGLLRGVAPAPGVGAAPVRGRGTGRGTAPSRPGGAQPKPRSRRGSRGRHARRRAVCRSRVFERCWLIWGRAVGTRAW